MPKTSASYELALPERDARIPTYQWLYRAIRSQILSGHLAPGTRLPATRDLARQHRIARGTVVSAFEQLWSEGYVQGSVGSGTYVSMALPEKLLHVGQAIGAEVAIERRPHPPLSNYARRARLFSGYEERPTRAFRSNLPALDLFPMDLWTKTTARCLRRASTLQLMGTSPLGYAPFRQAIAEYLGHSRGVRCEPEQVVVVSGVQEGLDLMARLLIDAGDEVCVEDPGYPGAIQVFQASKAKISWATVDEHGVVTGRLPRRRVRLIYITPGHQFPLGVTMTLARRLELLEWARASRAVVFEDDYDSEYRYSGRPIPALQGLDTHGSVVYAGSFSKVLFPALRLGYIVVPAGLIDRVAAVHSLTIRHTPVLEQLVLSDFIREGHFGRHIRRMREIYAQRHALLLDDARSKLAGLLEISGVEAGLQTVGRLYGMMNADNVAAAALKRSVDVTPISRYCYRARQPEALQLGFAAIDEKEIRRGVRELLIALETVSKTRAPG